MDFNEIAKHWDSEKRVQRAEIIGDEIYDYFKDLNTETFKALEFGCGTGLISFKLKDNFKTIDLFDTSEGMIKVLRSKIKETNVLNMNILTEKIPVENRYDIIYSSMAMHHIVDIEKTIEDLYSVLKDGGYLCIVDLLEEDGHFHRAEKNFTGHNGFNLNSFGNLLNKTGLIQLDSKIFYHGEKEVFGEKSKYSLFIWVGRKEHE